MTLNRTQFDSFKQDLLLLRDRLHNLEVNAVHSEEDRLDIKVERANNQDEAPDPVSIERDIALEGHLIESISLIDRALARIQRGDYGKCIDCERDIPVERLRAYPAAARCVDCKKIYEDSHKSAATPYPI